MVTRHQWLRPSGLQLQGDAAGEADFQVAVCTVYDLDCCSFNSVLLSWMFADAVAFGRYQRIVNGLVNGWVRPDLGAWLLDSWTCRVS